MNEYELTGRCTDHIVQLTQPVCSLHFQVAASFQAMCDAAATEGLVIQAASSFRSFEAQLQIWNRKWCGERPLYNREGVLLEAAALTADERLDAILVWSAIPGGSRHHWGSDLDLIDAAAMPPGYQVQLTPAEYAEDGVFARLSNWLDRHAAEFGFFRPYRQERGGVSPEPWHLSYAPVSMPAMEALSLATLRRVLESSELQGKAQVLARLPEIYTRFLLNIDLP